MKLFFSTASIPELKGFSIQERLAIIALATQKLTVFQKMTLNIARLLILTPLFLAVAQAEGWNMAYYVIPVLLLYPLITRPLSLGLCYPYIDYGIKELKKLSQ